MKLTKKIIKILLLDITAIDTLSQLNDLILSILFRLKNNQRQTLY